MAELQQLQLTAARHPDKALKRRFDALIGIDEQKQQLTHGLHAILDSTSLEKWLKKNHPQGLPYLQQNIATDPLVILSGDVGCGKTELASTVGSLVSDLMGGQSITVFETPSDIRGQGHVGEVSFRITEAFTQAKQKVRKGEYGILIIDEGDDLATSRDQMQAHHEDRAGVNALIKELDKLRRDAHQIAVILITNRAKALDPAVVRRASLHLTFARPGHKILPIVLKRVFDGVGLSEADLSRLAKHCAARGEYSYSDIVKRIAKQSLIRAWRNGTPLTSEVIEAVITETEPSPGIETVNTRAK